MFKTLVIQYIPFAIVPSDALSQVQFLVLASTAQKSECSQCEQGGSTRYNPISLCSPGDAGEMFATQTQRVCNCPLQVARQGQLQAKM